MATGIKRLVLCADDFGYSEGVCRGILELATNERVSAVSCLVEGPWWPQFAHGLSQLHTVAGGLVSVGLQWNLTDAMGEGPSIKSAVLAAYTGKLAVRAAATLDRQLDVFERHFGRMPDFIGGHQHVQQLPGARDVLLETIARRFGSAPPAVRNTVPAQARGLKAKTIASFGGHEFKEMLLRQGLSTHTDFDGIYDFGDDPPYGQHMQQWMARCAARGLIVCHPGMPGYRLDQDPIASARTREYRFLASDAFPASLSILGVGLMPLSAHLFSLNKTTRLQTL